MRADDVSTNTTPDQPGPGDVSPLTGPGKHAPDRNLALEPARVTEAASMAAARWVGRGDKNGADGAAVNAMRLLINSVSMRGVVVIGEGEKDQAPMLFNGEDVGDGTGAACALKCLGGTIQGRLAPRDEAGRRRALDAGHDLDLVLTTDDLVSSDDVFFAATGITDGELMEGVRYRGGDTTTHSLVMRSRSGTIRSIKSEHQLWKLRAYSSIDFD